MPAKEIRKFWEKTQADLGEVEIDEIVEQSDVFTMEGFIKTRSISRVIMSSFEGRRIHASYTLPSGQPPARGWPAIVEFPGYDGIISLPVHLAQYGYATLTLFPRGQGESTREWELEYGTKLVYNVTDRDKYYYRGAYMDCVRGVDFLCTRPEVDNSRIGVWGFSQGAGLSLVTASLDRRVSAAVAGLPFLCNFPIAVDLTTGPYVQLHDYLEEHPHERDTVLATLAYFDPLNLADSIACPTMIASSISDQVHPLSTVMPVFENIRAMKSIVVYPDLDHDYRTDFINHAKSWMDRYLR